MIKKNSKIFVAGHKGLVGSAIVRKLKENGYYKIDACYDKTDLLSLGFLIILEIYLYYL